VIEPTPLSRPTAAGRLPQQRYHEFIPAIASIPRSREPTSVSESVQQYDANPATADVHRNGSHLHEQGETITQPAAAQNDVTPRLTEPVPPNNNQSSDKTDSNYAANDDAETIDTQIIGDTCQLEQTPLLSMKKALALFRSLESN